jgi:hypothetical protein
MEARRFQESNPGPKLRVDYNVSTNTVVKQGNDLAVEFGLTASYGPLGMIKFEGAIIHRGSDVDDVLAQWTEKRALPAELAAEIHGGIFAGCMPEAMMMAKNLRLPPPIPLPQIRAGQPQAAPPAEGPDAA